MTFLNSLSFWAAMAGGAVLVPIVIHLFNRFRHRQTDWAAMEFLRDALVVRSRRVQIEDLLLLLMRCLAVLLIAAAFARPTISESGLKLLGHGQQSGAVIAIDSSFSMAHGGGASRFDRAKQRAEAILDTLAPGSPVTLVTMGAKPRVILRNVGYDKENFVKTLQGVMALPERMNLEPCLEEIESLFSEIKAPVRECYIVTDGQSLNWGNLPEKARQTLRSIGEAGRLFVVTTGTDNSENVAVTDLRLGSGTLRKGATVRYDAVIRNFGTGAAQNVSVTLSANDRPMDQRVLPVLGAGQSQVATLFFRCTDAGPTRLTATSSLDPLTIDNTRYTVAEVRERISILLVDGAPSPQPFKSETDLLMTALLPRRKEATRSLEVRRIRRPELGSQSLDEVDIVFLANIGDLSPDEMRALAAFVEGGGGLVAFAGDRVDPITFNTANQITAPPLFPIELTDLANAPAPGRGVELVAASSPLAAKLSALPKRLLDTVEVRRFFNTSLLPGAVEILRIAGAPLLVESKLGRGKVLFCTTSADLDWNDLPAQPLYLILLHEMVSHLTAPAQDSGFIVGQPLVLPLPQTGIKTVTARDPSGQQSEVAVSERDGAPSVELQNLSAPGFYELHIGKDEPPRVIAANVDTTESDVRCLTAQGLAAAVSRVNARVLTDETDIAATVRESRVGRELWPELLAAGLIVFLLESLLARRFSREVMAGRQGAETRATPEELLAEA